MQTKRKRGCFSPIGRHAVTSAKRPSASVLGVDAAIPLVTAGTIAMEEVKASSPFLRPLTPSRGHDRVRSPLSRRSQRGSGVHVPLCPLCLLLLLLACCLSNWPSWPSPSSLPPDWSLTSGRSSSSFSSERKCDRLRPKSSLALPRSQHDRDRLRTTG